MSAQPDFMNSKPDFNLKDPNNFHDRVIIVGDEKFYVAAGYLASFSEHFRAMFYGNFDDANKKEIEIKEVDPKAFEVFLYILCEKSYISLLNAKLMVPVINLAYRFLSPKVLEVCKEFFKSNIADLYLILLNMLETSCKYDIGDLKKIILDRLKTDAVISKFKLTVVLKYANRLKIEDLKAWLGEYVGKDVTFGNCSDRLDFAEKNNLPTLKTTIIAKVNGWQYYSVPEENIISLLKSAFKHDIQYLKNLVLWKMLTTNGSNITNGSFLRRYQAQVLALPIEIRDFIFKEMINRH